MQGDSPSFPPPAIHIHTCHQTHNYPPPPPPKNTYLQIEEVSKKLAPILQLGEGHQLENGDSEDKVAEPGVTPLETAASNSRSIQEASEVREAIRGRKESVIVKETKVL